MLEGKDDAVVEFGALPGFKRHTRHREDGHHMQGGEGGEEYPDPPQTLLRQAQRRPHQNKRHEGQQPVQADALHQREQRKECQRHPGQHVQRRNAWFATNFAVSPAPTFHCQPKYRRAQHIEQGDAIQKRRCQREPGITMAIDEIEHVIRPTVTGVPPGHQGQCRHCARIGHSKANKRTSRAPPQDIDQIGKAENGGKELRQHRPRQQQPGQQIPAHAVARFFLRRAQPCQG